MTQNIIIPPPLVNIINERVQIWEAAAKATQQAKDLEQLSEKLGTTNSDSAITGPLSKGNTPPEELAVAFAEITNLTTNIEKANQEIKTYQLEISKLEAEAKQRTMLFILGLIGLVIVIWFVLMSGR